MSFPSSPSNAQTAVVNGITYQYTSATNSWKRLVVAVGPKTTSSNSAPTAPAIGDIWYNTLTDDMYRYTSDGITSVWLDVTGPTLTSNASVISSGGGISWQAVQTTNFTAVAGNGYPVNTTAGTITVTLPVSPIAGQMITIVDYAGAAASNNIVIAPNGKNIQGSTVNVTIPISRQAYNFVYIDSTQGWISYSQQYAPVSGLPYAATYLLAAGGGGGGGYYDGGGAGAGGLVTGSINLVGASVYTITVGAGGAGGIGSTVATAGTNSTFNAIGITALGGGYGGGGFSTNTSGGSGGGSSNDGGPVGSGTSGQGNGGGTGQSSTPWPAGGGGGAGAVGGNGSGTTGGAGGVGLATILITTAQATSASVGQVSGGSLYFSGGGGGGIRSSGTPGAGGLGGGGNGAASGTASAATAYTGGGGGGAGGSGGAGVGGAGGSGCVIISVPTYYYSGTTTGTPTVVTNGSNTVMIFKASGSYTA